VADILKTAARAAAWAYLGLGAVLLTGVIVAHLPLASGR
jgi:hypothetical protein